MLRYVRTTGLRFGAQRAAMARQVRRWAMVRYAALCVTIAAATAAAAMAVVIAMRSVGV